MTDISHTLYHLPHNAPEKAVKRRIIYYYASTEDMEKARVLAKQDREMRNVAFTRDATVFRSVDNESCDTVVIMPDVPPHYRRVVEEVYAGRITKFDPEAVGLHSPPLLTPDRMVAGSTSVGPTASKDPEVLKAELELMSRKELSDYATSHGVTLSRSSLRREDMLREITEHRT